MKNKIIHILFVFFAAGFTFTSCTDYLTEFLTLC